MRALLLFISLLGASLPAWASTETLLLTGKISSSEKQIVTAPRGSRWNMQIQWMAEEGKIVNKGEPILLFDGTNELERLEQNKERVETLALEFKQLEMEQQQKVTEAKGALKVAELQVEKAKIEASIPEAVLSEYDKGLYDLALQRTLMELVKAQQALKLAEQEQQTSIQKKRIDILKVEEETAFLQRQLKKMQVAAELTGPVSYAMHPWNGEKLVAGMNVQVSWHVMDVQALKGLQIETWLHEMDTERLAEGQSVEIALDAFPGQHFMGRVALISSQAEKKQDWSRSIYFPVVIEFEPMPEMQLMPGMSARIVARQAGGES